ncbi:zinc finger protein 595-like [Belonocnema kinseyi]|uniref:zinc finger protein 595-like n=1 Tax=Belonocnema kinseyi TaxID=2817044 RepID=UPI00143DCE59|nr:zinc finger protein 595-like [Belonocnema kinseyi]
MDENLEIKEEIIQDPGTIAVHKGNKANKSKFCTVYIKGDDILEVRPKLQALKKQEIQEEKQGMKYTCKKCARSYTRNTTLTAHQKFDCGIMPQFSCKFCNRLFKKKSYMNRHIVRVHEKTSVNKSVLLHKCDECFRSYTSLSSLTRHKSSEHAAVKPKFICDYCGYKTNLKSSLLRHIASRHSQTLKTRYHCDKCPQSYTWLISLNQHKHLKHSPVKPQFFCDICGYKSNRKGNLVKHMTSKHFQTSSTRYYCDKCSRSYNWLGDLTRHKRSEHAAVKTRFICDHCGHKTNLKSSLAKHITSRHS